MPRCRSEESCFQLGCCRWTQQACCNHFESIGFADYTVKHALCCINVRQRSNLVTSVSASSSHAHRYTIRAIATIDGVDTSALQTLSISRSKLVASLSGLGSMMSSTSDVVLDGSSSGDPDNSTAVLTFSWLCTTVDGQECVRIDGSTLTLPPVAVVTIPNSTLASSSEGIAYMFTLTVSSSLGRRTSQVSLKTLLVSTQVPSVRVYVGPSLSQPCSIIVSHVCADTALTVSPFCHQTTNLFSSQLFRRQLLECSGQRHRAG